MTTLSGVGRGYCNKTVTILQILLIIFDYSNYYNTNL